MFLPALLFCSRLLPTSRRRMALWSPRSFFPQGPIVFFSRFATTTADACLLFICCADLPCLDCKQNTFDHSKVDVSTGFLLAARRLKVAWLTRLLFKINKATKWCCCILTEERFSVYGGRSITFPLLCRLLIPRIKWNCDKVSYSRISPLTYMW